MRLFYGRSLVSSRSSNENRKEHVSVFVCVVYRPKVKRDTFRGFCGMS